MSGRTPSGAVEPILMTQHLVTMQQLGGPFVDQSSSN